MVAVPLLPAGRLCPQFRTGLARSCCSVRPVGQWVPAATQLRGDGLRALGGERQRVPGLAATSTPANPAPQHPGAQTAFPPSPIQAGGRLPALTRLPRRLLLRLPPDPVRLWQSASKPRMPPTQSPSSTTCG